MYQKTTLKKKLKDKNKIKNKISRNDTELFDKF